MCVVGILIDVFENQEDYRGSNNFLAGVRDR